MFQFRRFPQHTYFEFQYAVLRYEPKWVSSFRNLRINAYLQLPAAYRSLSRLSSAPSAKAFALRPSSLDHQFAIFRLLLKASYTLIANKICYSLPVETVVSSSSKFYFISFRSYYSVLKVHLFEVPFYRALKIEQYRSLVSSPTSSQALSSSPCQTP